MKQSQRRTFFLHHGHEEQLIRSLLLLLLLGAWQSILGLLYLKIRYIGIGAMPM